MSTIATQIVFDRLPKIAAELKPKASLVVRKTALDVLAHAVSNLPDAAGRGVDTGNLKNSYRVGDEDNVFEMKRGATEATVGTNVEYAVYVEFGTHKMAPIPHLVPAAEAVRPAFMEAMKQIVGE